MDNLKEYIWMMQACGGAKATVGLRHYCCHIFGSWCNLVWGSGVVKGSLVAQNVEVAKYICCLSLNTGFELLLHFYGWWF